MIKDNMQDKVKKLLYDNTGKYYTIKDISRILHVGKHNYRYLKDCLIALSKNDYIQHKKGKYTYLPHLKKEKKIESRTVEGVFDATPLGKGYSYSFVICEKFDVYVSSEDTLNAYHGDKVKVDVFYSRKDRYQGRIIEVVKRNTLKFVGNIENVKEKQLFIPDYSKIHTYFHVENKENDLEGKKVTAEILNWGNRSMGRLPVVKILEVIGEADNPEIVILGIIKQFDLPLIFPDNVLSELEEVEEHITSERKTGRKDCRDLLTFTIDPETAKDYDDAVSLEMVNDDMILYVHIADVAEYVKVGSNMFQEALQRGNSYYFPKRVIPMLPEKISNQLCSLRPGEEKLTLTVQTSFDKNFNIQHQEVYESIIISNFRLTYEEVDAFFEGRDSELDETLAKDLDKLRLLSSALLQKRLKKGYLNFSLPDTDIVFDDKGEIQNVKRVRETESHMLIENCMLVANEYIANFLSEKTKKTIFRIHELPAIKNLKQLQSSLRKYKLKLKLEVKLNKAIQNVINAMPDQDYHRVFDRMILQSMQKAKYHTGNYGHFGLAMPVYTHFTSPIRRICDLTVHHQTKNVLRNRKEILFSNPYLTKISVQASTTEEIADQSEREVEKKYICLFMKKKIGEVFEGLIINLNKTNIIVELDCFPVRGVIRQVDIKGDKFSFFPERMEVVGKRTGRTFRLVQKLTVKVISVEEEIYFSVIN